MAFQIAMFFLRVHEKKPCGRTWNSGSIGVLLVNGVGSPTFLNIEAGKAEML